MGVSGSSGVRGHLIKRGGGGKVLLMRSWGEWQQCCPRTPVAVPLHQTPTPAPPLAITALARLRRRVCARPAAAGTGPAKRPCWLTLGRGAGGRGQGRTHLVMLKEAMVLCGHVEGGVGVCTGGGGAGNTPVYILCMTDRHRSNNYNEHRIGVATIQKRSQFHSASVWVQLQSMARYWHGCGRKRL